MYCEEGLFSWNLETIIIIIIIIIRIIIITSIIITNGMTTFIIIINIENEQMVLTFLKIPKRSESSDQHS